MVKPRTNIACNRCLKRFESIFAYTQHICTKQAPKMTKPHGNRKQSKFIEKFTQDYLEGKQNGEE